MGSGRKAGASPPKPGPTRPVNLDAARFPLVSERHTTEKSLTARGAADSDFFIILGVLKGVLCILYLLVAALIAMVRTRFKSIHAGRGVSHPHSPFIQIQLSRMPRQPAHWGGKMRCAGKGPRDAMPGSNRTLPSACIMHPIGR